MQHGLLDPASLRELVYAALDHSDDIVLVIEQTVAGTTPPIVAAANGAFCRLSRYDVAAVVGRPVADLIAPDGDAATVAELLRAVRDGRSHRTELLCARSDGTSFWLGLHLMPVPEAGLRRSVALGRDITEILRARHEHAAVQGVLAKVFLCVEAAVAIVDESGVVQMANPALGRLLGCPPARMAGRNSFDFVTLASRAAAAAARESQLASGMDYTIDAMLLREDGSELPVRLTSVLVPHADMRRVRIVTATPLAAAPVAAATQIHVAGKIRLIGLDAVKATLGAHWPQLAARAMASAEAVIRRRCGPHDTYARTSDGGFLICFGEATEDEAAFRAAMISREIRGRLIGEGETPATAHVSAVTASVEVPKRPELSQDMLAAAINARLNARLAQIEGEARQAMHAAVQNARCELAPIHGRHGPEVVAYFAMLPTALEWRLQRALAALPPAECQAFDFDRLVLSVAAEQVVAGLASGHGLPILVAVDFAVFLDRRSTERYVAACQALDERLRQRLILVLAHLPAGVPRSRVLDCVMRLRPFCHAVGFRSHMLEMPPVELSALSAAIVVVAAEDINLHDAEERARVERLIGVAHANRARVLVQQVADANSAQAMLQAGVDLVYLAPAAVPAARSVAAA